MGHKRTFLSVQVYKIRMLGQVYIQRLILSWHLLFRYIASLEGESWIYIQSCGSQISVS